VALTFAVLFAEPVRDGDLWWHMAYGRDMIANRTLIPDHTAYSWTRADGEAVYCAWVSEVLFHVIYRVGKLPLLYVFQYLCMSAFLFILWGQARRGDVDRHPAVWVVAILGVLMSYVGAFLKPEIFSYLLITLMVGSWMRVRRGDPGAWRWCYVFPALTLVWVNSHGGFIFGLAFLIVMFIGEEANALYSPGQALPLRTRRHLFVATALSGLCVLATPYGLRYPLQLARSLLGEVSSDEMTASIHAYASIFTPRYSRLHYPQYLALAAVILVLLAAPRIRGRRIDWAVIFTNVAFGCLYTRCLRTTFYWAPVFAFTCVQMLAEKPAWLWPRRRFARNLIGALAVVIVLPLTGRTIYECIVAPVGMRWLGFGISYFNPVEEAEFIREKYSGLKLGNDYNAGGYLLWRLWPETKVFIDPRQFPYKEWYGQYRAFESARDLSTLPRKYPCHVWCIQYRNDTLLRKYLDSPNWKPVFYGASAVVLAQKKIAPPDAPPLRGKGIARIRNLNEAVRVLVFTVNIGDREGTDMVLAGMRKVFRLPRTRRTVEMLSAYVDGVRAYEAGEYEKAAKSLRRVHKFGVVGTTRRLTRCYEHLTVRHWNSNNEKAALEMALAALRVMPEETIAVYNAAVIEWYLRTQVPGAPGKPKPGAATSPTTYRKNLALFLEKAKRDSAIPKKTVAVARGILANNCSGRPPLLVPPGAAPPNQGK